MTSPNAEQNQRIMNLMKDVMSSMSDRLQNIEKQGQAMEKKITSFQPKLFTHLKEKCKDQLNWLEKNGKFMENEGKVAVEFGDVDQKETEQKMQEWEQCSNQNDFGARKFFDEIDSTQQEAQLKQDNCMKSCLVDMDKKSDESLKSCVTVCFNDIMGNMEESFKYMETKVNDISSKLI